MATRNQGQRIQQLDPFAIQVAQPQVSVPNLPATRYYANTNDLENISRSLNLIGVGIRNWRELQIQEARLSLAQQEAADKLEAGAGRLAAKADSAVLRAAFDDDTLDTTVVTPRGPDGTPGVTLEDTVLRAIAESGDPVTGIRDWVTAQISDAGAQLTSESARQAYLDEAFVPVLQSAISWYNKREERQQSILRSDLATEIAGNSDDVTPAALVGLTADAPEYFKPLDEDQAVDVILEAVAIANADGKFDRARSLLYGIPEKKRRANWYEAMSKGEDQFLEALEDVITLEFQRSVFAPGGVLESTFGVNGDPDDAQVEVLDNAIRSMLADQSITPIEARRRLRMFQSFVPATGDAFRLAGEYALRIDDERVDQTQKRIRDENKYQATLKSIEVISEGTAVLQIGGKSVTIDMTDPQSNGLMRQYFIEKYNSDGYAYYDEFLALRGQKRYTTPTSEPDQDANSARLLERIREATSTSQRREIIKESFQAAKNGEITFAQSRALISESETLDGLSPEYESPDFKSTVWSIQSTMANAMGADMEGDMLSGFRTLTLSKEHDPAGHRAMHQLLMDFRNDYTRFLRDNSEERTSDPLRFRERQTTWLRNATDAYFERAIREGEYHSPPQYRKRINTP